MVHLDLTGFLLRRVVWPLKGTLDWCVSIYKALSEAAFSLHVRVSLKRCEGLLSATVEPENRNHMAQHCVLIRMFHSTGKLLEGQAHRGLAWQILANCKGMTKAASFLSHLLRVLMLRGSAASHEQMGTGGGGWLEPMEGPSQPSNVVC